jgi:hypothetical protein
MNFAEITKLHAQRGNDRQAIADALGLTPEMIDQMQREAMRIANEEASDTGGHQNI